MTAAGPCRRAFLFYYVMSCSALQWPHDLSSALGAMPRHGATLTDELPSRLPGAMRALVAVAHGHWPLGAIICTPGLWISPAARAGQGPVLAVVSRIQTIPSLAIYRVLIRAVGRAAWGQGRRSSPSTLLCLLPGAGGSSDNTRPHPWCRRWLLRTARRCP